MDDPLVARFAGAARLLLLLPALAVVRPCQAQSNQAIPPECRPQLYRFYDDCAGLADHRDALEGLDKLRYIPLARDRSVWLTLGGEYRLRIETLDPPNFGVAPADQPFTAVGNRFYADADLRTTLGWRVFVQLSAATDEGRKPAERPFDQSAPDLQQGFVEIPLLAGNALTTLRLGRQELDLGGTALVSPREAANLRLSFDMAHLETRFAGSDLVAFWGRPVVNRPGAFDDTAPSSESFYGLKASVRPRLGHQVVSIDFLLLGRDRDKAVYVDAVGKDERRLVGARVSGQSGPIDYQLSGSYEFGRVSQSNVSAYGAAFSIGYSFEALPWKPRFGVDLGLASGDRRRGDRQLDSFDPLYPNLGYFTDAQIDYPVNWAGGQPTVTLSPTPDLSLKAGVDLRFRESRNDGIYAPSTLPFIGPVASSSSLVDTAPYLDVTWRATRHIQFDLSYVHGFAGPVVVAAGGHDFNYGLVQTRYRF